MNRLMQNSVWIISLLLFIGLYILFLCEIIKFLSKTIFANTEKEDVLWEYFFHSVKLRLHKVKILEKVSFVDRLVYFRRKYRYSSIFFGCLFLFIDLCFILLLVLLLAVTAFETNQIVCVVFLCFWFVVI